MSKPIIFGRTQNAEQTPFDNSTNGFSATDVQAAIEEAQNSLILNNVTCDSTVYVNSAVRLDSSGTAFNALADVYANSNVVGIVISKASSTLCTIQVTGVTPANFSGLDPAEEYFLSAATAGALTTTPPAASGNIVLRVGQPFSATRMLMNKGTRIERA